jgi:hypothetical protein
VKVPIKTIQLSLPKKRGRSMAAPKDNAQSKDSRILRTRSSKSVNPSQAQVGRHPIVDNNAKPGSTMHLNSDPRTSEHPDAIVLGNGESNNAVKEISTNYIDSGESYNRKATIINMYCSTAIVKIFLNDLDLKTMVECKKRIDWT